MRQYVGFIGLGIMGRPMAKNLLKANVRLMVNDVDPAACLQLEECGAIVGSLEEIGRNCKTIFTILPNGRIVKSVLFAEGGLSQYLAAGSIVCDMSSTSLDETVFCQEKLAKAGVSFIDAPVSGGEMKAISGDLTYMVGASEKDYEHMIPYFNIMGSAHTRMGKVGCGCTAKWCNQIIVTMNIAIISEAFGFAEKNNIDFDTLFQAIRHGSAGSSMLESRIPKFMKRDFAPGGKISIHLKDIKNVVDYSQKMNMELPLTNALMEVLQEHNNNGYGSEDSSSLLLYYEER